MTATKIEKVALYARQSSGTDDGDASLSIQSQLDVLREYAEAKGWEIVMEATDANTSGRTYPDGPKARQLARMDSVWLAHFEGVPEAKRFRPGLGKVAAALPKVQAVLVYDATRLMRPLTNSFLQSHLQAEFVATDTLVCTRDGEPLDFASFSVQLVSAVDSIVQDRAVREMVRKAQLARKVLRDSGRVSSGKFAQTFGFRPVGRGKVEIDHEAAETIREMFRLYVGGQGISSIMRGLKAKGVKAQRGGGWSVSSVTAALKNFAYIGHDRDSRGNLIRVEDVPQIVDEPTYWKAQEIFRLARKGRTRKASRIHPLSGLVYCGYCGERLSLNYNYKQGNNYYKCHNTKELWHPEKAEDCKGTWIQENTYASNKWGTIHKSGLLQSLVPLVVYAAWQEWEANQADNDVAGEIARCESELASLDTQAEKLAGLVALGQLDAMDLPKFTAAITSRRAELHDELATLRAKSSAAAVDPRTWDYAGWYAMAEGDIAADNPLLPDYQRAARQVLDRITVYRDRVEALVDSGETVTLPRYRVQNSLSLPVVEGLVTVLGHTGATYLSPAAQLRKARAGGGEVHGKEPPRTLAENSHVTLSLVD